MLNKKFILNCSLAILVSTICLYLANTVFFRSLDLLSLDLLFNLRGAQPAQSQPVVVIEVTNEDIREIGRWPWRRTKIAQLCTVLNDLGAKNILFDILFTGTSTPDEDAAFTKVVQAAGNIYLPYVFTTPDRDIRKAFLPIPPLKKAAKGTGFVNIAPDVDGKLRKLSLFTFIHGIMYEHIVLRLVQDELGMTVQTITPTHLVLGNTRETINIPLTNGNKMLLNWKGKWDKTFIHYRFRELMQAYGDIQNRRPPRLNLSPIRNSTCVVAATALTLSDIRSNPLEENYPGAGVVATALTNIFERNFLTVIPLWLNILLIYLFALIPAFHISHEKVIKLSDVVVFLILLLLTPVLFFYNIVVYAALPFTAFFMSYLVISLYNIASRTAEKNKWAALATTDELTHLYNIRYFREILHQECRVAKADPKKNFCIILCDIDNFKGINDKHGHPAGDFVIANVAQNVKNNLRTDDVVARYGGDEMIILLRYTVSLEKAAVVAEKICRNIQNLKLNCYDQDCPVTLSLGVALFNPKQDDAQSIIQKADQALYTAKQNGKNRVFAKSE